MNQSVEVVQAQEGVPVHEEATGAWGPATGADYQVLQEFPRNEGFELRHIPAEDSAAQARAEQDARKINQEGDRQRQETGEGKIAFIVVHRDAEGVEKKFLVIAESAQKAQEAIKDMPDSSREGPGVFFSADNQDRVWRGRDGINAQAGTAELVAATVGKINEWTPAYRPVEVQFFNQSGERKVEEAIKFAEEVRDAEDGRVPVIVKVSNETSGERAAVFVFENEDKAKHFINAAMVSGESRNERLEGMYVNAEATDAVIEDLVPQTGPTPRQSSSASSDNNTRGSVEENSSSTESGSETRTYDVSNHRRGPNPDTYVRESNDKSEIFKDASTFLDIKIREVRTPADREALKAAVREYNEKTDGTVDDLLIVKAEQDNKPAYFTIRSDAIHKSEEEGTADALRDLTVYGHTLELVPLDPASSAEPADSEMVSQLLDQLGYIEYREGGEVASESVKIVEEHNRQYSNNKLALAIYTHDGEKTYGTVPLDAFEDPDSAEYQARVELEEIGHKFERYEPSEEVANSGENQTELTLDQKRDLVEEIASNHNVGLLQNWNNKFRENLNRSRMFNQDNPSGDPVTLVTFKIGNNPELGSGVEESYAVILPASKAEAFMAELKNAGIISKNYERAALQPPVRNPSS